MAIRLIEEYPNRVGAPTADYPHGVPRNKSTPTATDGTPFEQSWFRDQEGFFQGLMETAGITPSGAPDTVLNSDYLDALNRVTNGVIEVDMGGAADVSLSAYQGRVAALKLTGALAADVDLIVPDTERMYWIIDETTGDFSVTVKTAAGTGVKLFGDSSVVRSDGTNVVPFVNGLDRRVIYVDTIADLQALDTSGLVDGQQFSISSTGDIYQWDDLDLSGRVARDPNKVLIAPPDSDSTGASGAFVMVSGRIRNRGAVLTVGSGGDFASLNSCASYLLNFSLALEIPSDLSADATVSVDIKILSGHVITDTMYLKAQNLGWAAITSEDAVVSATLSGSNNLFDWNNGSYGPVISTLFDMIGSGDAGTASGMLIRKGSYAIIEDGCGVINAPYRGLHLVNSMAWAVGSVWDGAGYSTTTSGPKACIRPGNGSRLMARFCSAKNNQGDVAVSVGYGGFALLQGADLSGALGDGIRVSASSAEVNEADISNCGGFAIRAEGGGHAEAVDAILSGCGAGETSSVNCVGLSVIVASGADITQSSGSVAAVYALSGGQVICDNADMSNAAAGGAYSLDGALVSAHNATALNVGGDALRALGGTISARGFTGTGAGQRGAYSADGGDITITNADMSGSVSGSDIRFRGGSIVRASGAIGVLDTENVENSVTSYGVMFR